MTILHPEVLTPPTVRVMHPDADTSCTQGVRDNEVEPFEDVRLHFLGDVLLPPTGPGPQVDVSHGPGCACRTVHVPVLGHMAPTGHPNVLVVEDDVLGGNALARALHAVDVTVVRNISQAETIMQGTPNRWTHVFLDVILPDGDGVDLCTRMRTQMRFGVSWWPSPPWATMAWAATTTRPPQASMRCSGNPFPLTTPSHLSAVYEWRETWLGTHKVCTPHKYTNIQLSNQYNAGLSNF